MRRCTTLASCSPFTHVALQEELQGYLIERCSLFVVVVKRLFGKNSANRICDAKRFKPLALTINVPLVKMHMHTQCRGAPVYFASIQIAQCGSKTNATTVPDTETLSRSSHEHVGEQLLSML